MTLKLIGYWRNDEHPEYPDPQDLVDDHWDADDRDVMSRYFGTGVFVRGYMGFSPCRICGKANGASEYTDGVLVWPEGLSHYVVDHGVRLPKAIEDYVLRTVGRLERTPIVVEWWEAGAPTLTDDGPLEPLQRVVWRGNAQLVHQLGRRFPGLFVQGDTLSNHVDGPKSKQLLRWYEEMMIVAGLEELPYFSGSTP